MDKKCNCPDCDKRLQLEQEAEEVAMAILIALVPMMTLALFNNLGLISIV